MDRGEANDSAALPSESTAAQNFADDLDSVFGLSAGVATLSQTVEEKKASVSHGQSELEQLQVRLRATEERLAKVSRDKSPSRQADIAAGGAQAQQPAHSVDRPPPPPPKDDATRTAEATQPRTPGRDDYVMVDRTAQQ